MVHKSKGKAAAKHNKETEKLSHNLSVDDETAESLSRTVVQLTDQELKEEFTRMLTADNPRIAKDSVIFDFKLQSFVKTPQLNNNLVVHLSIDGHKIEADSEEGRRRERAKKNEGSGAKTKGDEEGEEGKKKSKKNQFNFTERASQTYNRPYKEQGTHTEAVEKEEVGGFCSQWVIHQAYQRDQQKDKKEEVEVTNHKQLTTRAKIIERMVNQNIYNSIVHDLKYFEDGTDETKEQGSLLPLWRFKLKKKQLQVTDVCWSGTYHDLFAASYGSYDLEDQSNGIITFNTLKNPSHPEITIQLHHSVMCIDIHPTHPNLLVAGLSNGQILVYDVTSNQEALFNSDLIEGRHDDVVWKVRWQSIEENNLNFYSVSRDGRFLCWTIIKNEMSCWEVMSLEEVEGMGVSVKASCSSLDLHPYKRHWALVACEGGMVHLCATNQCVRFLCSYQAHLSTVNQVHWNQHHEKVFATCGDDCCVRIWHVDHPQIALLHLELSSAVMSVQWSSFSSTVLAASTADSKIHIYDLNISKVDSLCRQNNLSSAVVNTLAFNHFVLLTGDSLGILQTWKLSPNLRRIPKGKKGHEQLKEEEKEVIRHKYEVDKIQKILDSLIPKNN